MNWVLGEWPLLLALAAVWWLLPYPGRRGRAWGIVLGLVALVAAGVVYLHPTGAILHDGLFYLFSASAVVSAVCMITNSNPVYAALWFALVTLSTCGLYLLQAAPFLAAATIVVYAGAIIVTFLFVIMLARQAGSAPYDRSAREPFVASLTAFVLLGAIFHTLGEWRLQASEETSRGAGEVSEVSDGLERAKRFVAVPGLVANPLSRPNADQFGTMHALGRSLFGDYLFAVELAGTLLLVASIGAILIVPRRSQEGP